MAGYLGSVPVPQATQHRESFTCTEGQTSFATAGYTAQFVDVYLNGSHLSPADFTATNGSDVVLAVAASADDVCDIISYTPFEVANQTFTGTTTMDVAAITGVLTANGGAVFNEGSADVDFRVESNGNANMLFVDGGNNAVVIGHNDVVNIAAISPSLQIEGTGFAGSAVGQYRYSADAYGPTILFASSRNASIAGQTILQNNDELGKLRFYGSDGNDFENYGAEIIAAVDGTPGNNDMPGRIIFSTTASGAASPTERMRIDSSGNVGIGNSIPSSFSIGNLVVGSGSGTEGISIYSGNDSEGIIRFADGTSGAEQYQGQIKYHHDGNYLRFFTATGERMRIDSSGNVLVGKTAVSFATAGIELSASDVISITRNAGSLINVNRIGSSAGTAIVMHYNGTDVGSIDVADGSTSYNTSSDYRLKTDAQPMTGATARLKALNPVNFEWISSGERVDGFLAHEAQAIVPEAVTGTKDAMMDQEYEVSAAVEEVTDDDGNVTTEAADAVMGTRSVPDMQGIDQSKLVPLLVKTIQELEARITALEG